MATYDNKHWLLSNIRNSFISTDDTGMCEIVMTGENYPKLFYGKAMEEKSRMKVASPSKSKESGLAEVQEEVIQKEIVSEYDPYPDMEDSDDEDLINGSYIRYEDFGPHRQRSNTAQWLDRKEQEMKKAAKIKVVKWETPNSQITAQEKLESFPRKDLGAKKEGAKQSLLSEQLEKCPHLPHRQYLEYAKFDGEAQLGLPTKKFKIFMTMLPEKNQNYPVKVCVIANAKIHDLIGFTCYKYSIEHPDITLGSVSNYGLCIAEDDGEVDWAFPCLDTSEPCFKFGFTCLGLIDLKNKSDAPSSPICLPEDDGLSTAFQMIFPKPDRAGQSHNNGSRHNTGGSGTSEAVMYAIQAVNEDKKTSNREELDKIQSHITATEAPQYRAYRVQLLNRVRANTPVQLGVAAEKVEVEPLVVGGNKFWPRTKYFLHTIDTVAWCQVLEAKARTTVFRLVYTRPGAAPDKGSADSSFFSPSSAFKHHDFECDHETAKQIVEKVNRILDLRNSPCRREYKTAKERKLHTRKSFQTPPKNVTCS